MDTKSAEYQVWAKRIQPGDNVWYWAGSYNWNRYRKKATVVKKTATGMIRLEDGTLWYHHGGGQGGLSFRNIFPLTPEVELEEATKQARSYLNNYDFNSLDASEVLRVLDIIKSTEKGHVGVGPGVNV